VSKIVPGQGLCFGWVEVGRAKSDDRSIDRRAGEGCQTLSGRIPSTDSALVLPQYRNLRRGWRGARAQRPALVSSVRAARSFPKGDSRRFCVPPIERRRRVRMRLKIRAEDTKCSPPTGSLEHGSNISEASVGTKRPVPSSLFGRIRFHIAKLIYDGFLFFTVRDQSWQQPLFSSLAPRANDRILDLGRGSASTAVMLGRRFPEASFVGFDPSPKAVKMANRSIVRRRITNVRVVGGPVHGRLAFEAGSFDKAVCVLAFHDRPPDEKFVIAKEILRVLRRGGTLHVADYDKPTVAREAGALRFAQYISGHTARKTPHAWKLDRLSREGWIRRHTAPGIAFHRHRTRLHI
jgi:ubiquinone/menaquinone biosynthesis C-methylase UbiE